MSSSLASYFPPITTAQEGPTFLEVALERFETRAERPITMADKDWTFHKMQVVWLLTNLARIGVAHSDYRIYYCWYCRGSAYVIYQRILENAFVLRLP